MPDMNVSNIQDTSHQKAPKTPTPLDPPQYNSQGVYCGLSTASEVFLVFTTQLYQYLSAFFLFALFSNEPEVFPTIYSQTAILPAAHFRRVVSIHVPVLSNRPICIPISNVI